MVHIVLFRKTSFPILILSFNFFSGSFDRITSYSPSFLSPHLSVLFLFRQCKLQLTRYTLCNLFYFIFCRTPVLKFVDSFVWNWNAVWMRCINSHYPTWQCSSSLLLILIQIAENRVQFCSEQSSKSEGNLPPYFQKARLITNLI